jgi:hypothetical protein
MLKVESTELWLRARVKPHSAYGVARGGIAEVPVAERLCLRVGALGGFAQELQHAAQAPHDALVGVPPAARDRHETDFDARLLHGSAALHTRLVHSALYAGFYTSPVLIKMLQWAPGEKMILTNASLTATFPACTCACVCEEELLCAARTLHQRM